VYTEPASNMATKSIGFRVTNELMREGTTKNYEYYMSPGIMLGISKKIMIHATGSFGNNDGKFKAQAASLYLKYRFYSIDDVHSHFRVAAFAKGSYNNNSILQPAIELGKYNSGYEAGLVATKLISKLALSVSSYFSHATDNGADNKFNNGDEKRDALSYTLSAGRLIMPVTYKDYNQTNLNLMLEVLGQANLSDGKSYLDLAPSLQFIFLSRMRLDLGYRFAVVKDLRRTSVDGFLLRLEYNIFNAYK
jgi:hypothetical protein